VAGGARPSWSAQRFATIEITSGRVTIDPRLSDFRQLLVGSVFLIEVLLKNTGAVVAAHLLRPGNQRAVAGDLIMLDRLRGSWPAAGFVDGRLS